MRYVILLQRREDRLVIAPEEGKRESEDLSFDFSSELSLAMWSEPLILCVCVCVCVYFFPTNKIKR